jgi:hypothetical protein
MYLGVDVQLQAPAALSPGKDPPVTMGLEAGRAPKEVWTMCREEKSYSYRDSNSDPSAIQPVASRYSDYAV